MRYSNSADVNARSEQDKTALMFAAFMSKNEMVKLLLKHGADFRIKDKWGKSILNYAEKYPEIIKLLKKSGSV